MSSDGDRQIFRRAGRIISTRYSVPIFLVGTLLILLFGIVINTMMTHLFSNDVWQRWSYIGQAFEAIAAIFAAFGFIALVVTFLMQFKELQLQRQELGLQRYEMSQTQAELHRSAEADLRRLHVELLRMAIHDAELGAVWPDPDAEAYPHSVRRQFWYANLIYQHSRLAMELGRYDADATEAMVRNLFRSKVIRDYWRAGAEVRARTLVADSAEWRFAQMADAVYAEVADPPGPGQRLVD